MAQRKAYHEKKRNQMTATARVMCQYLSGSLVVEDEFTTDKKTGYKVRVFTKDAPCKKEDVRHLLVGNRVVDLEEIYAQVGKNVFGYMLDKGYLKPSSQSKELFWVTDAAARNYNLPKVLNCEFPA
tara:strand:+ start:362 stop:739 length:378 start_codon:yes stop_codon:yes gene_type:complete